MNACEPRPALRELLWLYKEFAWKYFMGGWVCVCAWVIVCGSDGGRGVDAISIVITTIVALFQFFALTFSHTFIYFIFYCIYSDSSFVLLRSLFGIMCSPRIRPVHYRWIQPCLSHRTPASTKPNGINVNLLLFCSNFKKRERGKEKNHQKHPTECRATDKNVKMLW